MKIALITDTHWGIRGDVVAFHDYFKKSVDEFFLPTLRSRGIKQIVHLGDLVDRRKFINFMTAHRLRIDFLEPVNNEFQMDIIIGNHDTYYKNTNELNALREIVVGKYDNIKIYSNPHTREFNGVDVLYVPWICDDNSKQTIEMIEATNAQICFGHLELAGFEMYKGHMSDHGQGHELFDKFDVVCSGHYHHKSDNKNIHYLGAFAEFTWTDYDDPRGFHIFDTETRELEFIQNPYSMFVKIWYDDINKTIDEVILNDYEVKGKIVKIIVKNKTNPYWFDLFIDKIENQSPMDMQVVEDNLQLDLENDDIVNEAEDTISIFKNYIGQLNMEGTKKDKLEKTIVELYQEAIAIQ
jgi:predicted phosphodiesterase